MKASANGSEARQVVPRDVDGAAPHVGQPDVGELGEEPTEPDGGSSARGEIVDERAADASVERGSPAAGAEGDASVACDVEVVNTEAGVDDRLAPGPPQPVRDELGDGFG